MTTSNTAATGATTGHSTENDNTATAKMASAAHTAVDIAAANLEQAEKALRDARTAAGHKVNETAKQAQSYSEDALASVKTYIDHYPLRSVGIALATGYVLSSLLKK